MKRIREKVSLDKITAKQELLKTLSWQILAFFVSQVLARIYFGTWEVSSFVIILCLSLIPIYFVYDKIWERLST